MDQARTRQALVSPAVQTALLARLAHICLQLQQAPRRFAYYANLEHILQRQAPIPAPYVHRVPQESTGRAWGLQKRGVAQNAAQGPFLSCLGRCQQPIAVHAPLDSSRLQVLLRAGHVLWDFFPCLAMRSAHPAIQERSTTRTRAGTAALVPPGRIPQGGRARVLSAVPDSFLEGINPSAHYAPREGSMTEMPVGTAVCASQVGILQGGAADACCARSGSSLARAGAGAAADAKTGALLHTGTAR